MFPVGRLDFDAEGLMILTNDGSLAQAFASSFEQDSKDLSGKSQRCSRSEIIVHDKERDAFK